MSIIKTFLVSVCLLFCMVTAHADVAARVVYADPINTSDEALRNEIKDSDAVNSVILLINSHFELTEPLDFYFGGDDGPLYDGENNQIVIPYGFLEEVKSRFNKVNYNATGVTADEATKDALMHALFHEFAHAVIDMYQLPVLGKEEDAADALANVLLIEFYEDGQEIALSAADLFDLESDDRDILEDEDFWGEHSLDDQRYFSTLCHVYGSDPDQYVSILEEGLLSEERAELCIEEYESVSQSWLQLLEPHTKHSEAN